MIKVQVAQESFLSRLQRERSENDEASKKVENTKLNARGSSALENKLRTLASTELFSTTAENKRTVTFSEDEDEALEEEAEKISAPVNKLERTKQKRVYHSSSSEAEEDEEEDQKANFKSKRVKRDVLSKLESFDGGFWCDDSDKPLPIRTSDKTKHTVCETEEEVVEEKKEITTTDNNMFKNPTGSVGFSLLSTYGAKNEDHDDDNECTNQVSEVKVTETFAWKLKEKAAIESAKGDLEPFFFTTNDKRFKEGQGFLQRTDSLNELRTKYDEKRPVLASIIKKKVKSRTKKQENKLSFAVNDKKKKRFNVKRKSGKQFKH